MSAPLFRLYSVALIAGSRMIASHQMSDMPLWFVSMKASI